MPAASLRSAAGGFRSDTGGLASLVRRSGSVRRARQTDVTHRIKFEDLTPFLRKLRNWSFRIKAVPNDQCGSVRKVLSVRRRRPRFARPPIGFGSSSLGKRTWLTHLRTQSNLRTSLRSYVTDRSGSKAYRNDQLWKTSVESHLVKYVEFVWI